MNSDQKMDNFTVYYRVIETPTDKVYEYWYYYTYNDWVNKHYHDWEKTYVFVNVLTGTVDLTVADAHEWWCPNSQLEKPGVDHLGVLAEEGGHAFAIDKNENGFPEDDEASIFPSYQPFFGKVGNWLSAEQKYLWSPGQKVPASDSHYQLREMSPGFIRKFQGLSEFPNSPELKLTYITVPDIIEDYKVEMGGKSATLPWNSIEYNSPWAISQKVGGMVLGKIKTALGIPLDKPAIIGIFSDTPKWAFTNQSGDFEMVNIEPGIHEVVVNAEGFAPYKQRFLHEENTTLGVDGVMNMFPESESFRIVGYVKNQDNSSADNITVDVYDSTNSRILTTLTDANGTYLFFVSEKSDYRVVALNGSETGSAKLKGVAGTIVGGNITMGTDRKWPVSNFTASLTTIPNYQTVQFIDTSENIPEKWYWDFGDGENSTEQNPKHLYRLSGNFTVNFTAANDLGGDKISRKDYIHVFDAGLPPQAGFTSNYTYSYDPWFPIGSTAVQYNDQSQFSGNSSQWFWDFGDGTNSTEQNPVHSFTYQDPSGSYTVYYTITLTVTDSVGRTSSFSDYVTIFRDLQMDFVGEPTSGATPLNVNFIELPGETPEDWVPWYSWDFGDGSGYYWTNPWDGSLPQINISHVYSSPGNYSVTFVKSLGEGGSYAKKKDYYIHVGEYSNHTIADFTANTTSGKEPLAVTFTDQSTHSPTTWTWSFGDGGTSAEQNPEHVYQAAGVYTVSLTASNNNGTNTTEKTDYIHVYPIVPPVAEFTANMTSGYSSLAVHLTDMSDHLPINWTWDFGDGSTSIEQNPEHTYIAPGNYTVSLFVMNDEGSDSTAKTDYIQVLFEVPPIIDESRVSPISDFTANTTSGKAPLAIAFTDTSVYYPGRWNWSFGDGVTSTEQNPEHLYTSVGTYSVNLTTGNAFGENLTIKTDYITVFPRTAPDASFTATPVSGKVPLTVVFNDTSTSSPTTWLWDFGDGTTSPEQHPVHEYTAAGTYTVSLTATNDDGSDTETRPEYITVTPLVLPIADFTVNTTSGQVPLAVEFTDISSGTPTSWSWAFGDGGVSEEQNPVHVYITTGQFTVSLQVTNEDGSNTTTKEQYITGSTIILPAAEFIANTTSGDAPLAVGFTDQSAGSPLSWLWSFGDGATSAEQNPEHIYTSAGSFTVSLEVTNHDGSNMAAKPDYITVTSSALAPVANFTGKPTCGKAPLSVKFTDASTGNPTGWYWNFGDGTNSIGQNPVHVYTAAGKYTVSLTATNGGGSNTSTRKDYISVSGSGSKPPVANFYAKPASGKAPLPVKFTDASTGNPANWYWEFGDGTNATERNPVHRYTIPGKYTVSLTVSNAGGSDTKTRNKYISVEGTPPPTADFYGKPISGKAPLNVRFTDTSKGTPTSWYWEFGDGTNGTAQNPVHSYISAGKYTVSLTASNVGGSTTKTRTQYITVSSPALTPTPTHTCTTRPATTSTTKPTTTCTKKP